MITQKSCLTLFLLSVLKKTVVKHIKSSKIDVDIVSITDILLMLLLLNNNDDNSTASTATALTITVITN